MHDSKFLKVYLRVWIDKYNKVQRKRFLADLCTTYKSKVVRNKLFSRWMYLTSLKMCEKIQEIEVATRHHQLMQERVFGELRYNIIKSKRERIISSIISERWETLKTHTILQTWKERYLSKLQKRTLYWQVSKDYERKIVLKSLNLLCIFAETSKQKRIVNLLERQAEKHVIDEDQDEDIDLEEDKKEIQQAPSHNDGLSDTDIDDI
jgi:hypothetical protein